MSSTSETIAERYVLGESIGKGGFAWVYAAQDLKLDREVAIKFLNVAEADPDYNEFDRFENEARMLAKVRHPNVVQVFDYGAHKNQPYIVMERLEGEDFSLTIDLARRSQSELEEFLLGALDGLAVAHKLGLVHKDLKPQNLFLASDVTGERLVVIDYGLGRRLDEERRLTNSGKIAGSPSYLPPEYIEDYSVSPRNDVYQMALIIVEAFTGERVVNHTEIWDSIQAHLNGDLPIPESFKSHRWYEPILKALSTDPNERFANADEFAKALHATNPENEAPVPVEDHSPPTLKNPRFTIEADETSCTITNDERPSLFRGILALCAVFALVLAVLMGAWEWLVVAGVMSFVAIGAMLLVDHDCRKFRLSTFDVQMLTKKHARFPLVDVKGFHVSGGKVTMKVGWKNVQLFQNLHPEDALKIGHYLNTMLERFQSV